MQNKKKPMINKDLAWDTKTTRSQNSCFHQRNIAKNQKNLKVKANVFVSSLHPCQQQMHQSAYREGDYNDLRSSSSSKYTSLLSSGGETYKPLPNSPIQSSVNSAQHQERKEQYQKDSERDIQDIKQFLKSNKNFIRNFNIKPESEQSPINNSSVYSRSSQIQQNQSYKSKDSQNIGIISMFCKQSFITIFVILLLVFLICGKDTQQKILQKGQDCWEMFKKSKCDANSPVGVICQNLYDCILLERVKKTNQNMASEQNNRPFQSNLPIYFVIIMIICLFLIGFRQNANIIKIAKLFIQRPNIKDKEGLKQKQKMI